jgi:cell division septum initiation protein DivIVA
VSLRRTLDVMGATLERASSFPLSASCMVNRAEMLSLVERARAELPVELDEAAALLVAHQDVNARAERDAEQLLARAQARADELLDDSALVATARGRSEQILHAARSEAARLLREADEYCDGRLAQFENDLERAMAQVRRGRDRLRERSNLQPAEAEVAAVDIPGPEGRSADEAAYDNVAYDTGADDWSDQDDLVESDDRLVHAQAGGPSERRIVDLAGMERGAAERSGLGQRANLQ